MALGTVTASEERLYNVHKVTFAWTAGTGAEEGTASGTTTYPYSGQILRVVTVPAAGGDAPTALYDITLTDEDTIDTANGLLANRSATATEWVTTGMGAVVGDKLTLNITNAGSAKKGTVIAYVGITPEEAASDTTEIIQGLYGGDGIATFPVAAAAGDGVSMAEVIRWMQEFQIGTVVNTTGLPTLAGILGDVGNDNIADRLTRLENQVRRAGPVRNIASIASTNLWRIDNAPVRVLSLVGVITTTIEATANATKLTHTATGGAAVDLCATLDVTGDLIRTLLVLDGVKATPLVNTADAGVVIDSALHMPLVLTPGIVALNCAAVTTGAVSWYIEYEPLAPTALVTAV